MLKGENPARLRPARRALLAGFFPLRIPGLRESLVREGERSFRRAGPSIGVPLVGAAACVWVLRAGGVHRLRLGSGVFSGFWNCVWAAGRFVSRETLSDSDALPCVSRETCLVFSFFPKGRPIGLSFFSPPGTLIFLKRLKSCPEEDIMKFAAADFAGNPSAQKGERS